MLVSQGLTSYHRMLCGKLLACSGTVLGCMGSVTGSRDLLIVVCLQLLVGTFAAFKLVATTILRVASTTWPMPSVPC